MQMSIVFLSVKVEVTMMHSTFLWPFLFFLYDADGHFIFYQFNLTLIPRFVKFLFVACVQIHLNHP